jgi:hypothetical protein
MYSEATYIRVSKSLDKIGFVIKKHGSVFRFLQGGENHELYEIIGYDRFNATELKIHMGKGLRELSMYNRLSQTTRDNYILFYNTVLDCIDRKKRIEAILESMKNGKG